MKERDGPAYVLREEGWQVDDARDLGGERWWCKPGRGSETEGARSWQPSLSDEAAPGSYNLPTVPTFLLPLFA